MSGSLTNTAGRALIHVLKNPFVTKGYLSWSYLPKKLELYSLSAHINLKYVILNDPICIYKVVSELVSSTLCSL